MIPRQYLLDPKIYEIEQDLTRKLYDAVKTLSPIFRFQLANHELPIAEIKGGVETMSYNPHLNRVRASQYDYPFSNIEVGEEAGHFIHFKLNPLFGKYSNEEGLLLRRLIECVGRYSGLVYASIKGERFTPTKDLQSNLKLTHELPYLLAEQLFAENGNQFLSRLARMKSTDFKKLKSEFESRRTS